MFNTKNTQFLDYFYEGEHLCIYPWGHGLRVHDSFFDGMHGGLFREEVILRRHGYLQCTVKTTIITEKLSVTIVNKNGKITLSFMIKNKIILEEFWREQKF